MKEKLNEDELALLQMEAKKDQMELRTKLLRMEAARRNVEILSKICSISSYTRRPYNDALVAELMNKNLKIMDEI